MLVGKKNWSRSCAVLYGLSNTDTLRNRMLICRYIRRSNNYEPRSVETKNSD